MSENQSINITHNLNFGICMFEKVSDCWGNLIRCKSSEYTPFLVFFKYGPLTLSQGFLEVCDKLCLRIVEVITPDE